MLDVCECIHGLLAGLKYFRTPPTMLTNYNIKASVFLKYPNIPVMPGTFLDCQVFGFLYPHPSSTEPRGLL